jgi:excisionase family DNA binding protein
MFSRSERPVTISFTENTLQVEMLSIEQFAAKMGVGRTTIYDWIKSGHLLPGRHYVKIGGTIRFPWGPELLQRLSEDSRDAESQQEQQHKADEPIVTIPRQPATQKRITHINLEY